MPEPPPPPPELRASDAERERTAQALRRHAGEGRLDPDELEERLGRAYAARTHGDLRELVADLPADSAPPLPARRGSRMPAAFVPTVVRWAVIDAIVLIVWLGTGASGGFWPGWVWMASVIVVAFRTLRAWEEEREAERRRRRRLPEAPGT